MADQGQGKLVPAQGTQPGAPGVQRHASMPGAGHPQVPAAPDAADAREIREARDPYAGSAGWAAQTPGADVWRSEEDGEGSEGPESDTREGMRAGESAHTTQMRIHARQQLREFLRAVPRREEDATLAIVRPDGTTRVFTRAELSAAIDRLRPRQRQIIRLAVEERWPRQRVCDYLRHISIKTFERDQVEALDILTQL
jgi:hypothetical protein